MIRSKLLQFICIFFLFILLTTLFLPSQIAMRVTGEYQSKVDSKSEINDINQIKHNSSTEVKSHLNTERELLKQWNGVNVNTAVTDSDNLRSTSVYSDDLGTHPDDLELIVEFEQYTISHVAPEHNHFAEVRYWYRLNFTSTMNYYLNSTTKQYDIGDDIDIFDSNWLKIASNDNLDTLSVSSNDEYKKYFFDNLHGIHYLSITLNLISSFDQQQDYVFSFGSTTQKESSFTEQESTLINQSQSFSPQSQRYTIPELINGEDQPVDRYLVQEFVTSNDEGMNFLSKEGMKLSINYWYSNDYDVSIGNDIARINHTLVYYLPAFLGEIYLDNNYVNIDRNSLTLYIEPPKPVITHFYFSEYLSNTSFEYNFTQLYFSFGENMYQNEIINITFYQFTFEKLSVFTSLSSLEGLFFDLQAELTLSTINDIYNYIIPVSREYNNGTLQSFQQYYRGSVDIFSRLKIIPNYIAEDYFEYNSFDPAFNLILERKSFNLTTGMMINQISSGYFTFHQLGNNRAYEPLLVKYEIQPETTYIFNVNNYQRLTRHYSLFFDFFEPGLELEVTTLSNVSQINFADMPKRNFINSFEFSNDYISDNANVVISHVLFLPSFISYRGNEIDIFSKFVNRQISLQGYEYPNPGIQFIESQIDFSNNVYTERYNASLEGSIIEISYLTTDGSLIEWKETGESNFELIQIRSNGIPIIDDPLDSQQLGSDDNEDDAPLNFQLVPVLSILVIVPVLHKRYRS